MLGHHSLRYISAWLMYVSVQYLGLTDIAILIISFGQNYRPQ